MRYNSQAFGHLQVDVSTVSWISRLPLGLVGTDGLLQKVVYCTRFRKLLQVEGPQQCLSALGDHGGILPNQLRLDASLQDSLG